MKNRFLLVSLIFALTGCDSILDKYPQTDISSENFWKTEDDFKLAANSLYNSIDNNHGETIDLQSDDYYGKTVNSISAGTYVSPNTDDVWSNAYSTIRKSNDLIENSYSSIVEPKIKSRYVAEARFFRAYQYFELIKKFGDVPLVLKTLDISSPELYQDRTDRSIVVDSIIFDLKFSIDNLPQKKDLSETEQGRITRGAALSLLSRIALNEGTFRKFHNRGEYKDLLKIAKESAFTVIQEKEYSLFNDFLGIFKEENEGNSETILRKFYKETVTDPAPRTRGIILDAIMTPTKSLVDAFLCKDGLPIEYSPIFKGYGDITTEFIDRDSRLTYTVWEPLTPFENNAPMIPELYRTRTGYWPKKPGDVTSLEKTFVYTDYILMRYAEVLLNYAEASFELDDYISDQDLDISINELRRRVDMPSLTNAFIENAVAKGYAMNMRDEIRRERRVELAGEGYRYSDIIRWKIAENILPNSIRGAKFQENRYPGVVIGKDVILDDEGFIIVENSKARTFENPKNYLFPLPLRELSLNPKLIQNQGWN